MLNLDRGNPSKNGWSFFGQAGADSLFRNRLITIFDCKIVLAWTGTTSDGTDVAGTVTIPEVSHEVTVDKLSEYLVSRSS